MAKKIKFVIEYCWHFKNGGNGIHINSVKRWAKATTAWVDYKTYKTEEELQEALTKLQKRKYAKHEASYEFRKKE